MLISHQSTKQRMPDILDCISNLSSDEVFTPPSLVNKMLDDLPIEVWTNKNLKWLDAACKTGIFLREVAQRLMIGLQTQIPIEKERRDYIFKNMLYGLPITDLTAMMSRRTLYTSKNAKSKFSVVQFQKPCGNIQYIRTEHSYHSGNCEYCGIKENIYDRGQDLENYAYQFIHNPNILKTMKFDVIIGNPPYQISDGGFGASAMPIYHKFVQQAIALKPKYVSFIIPSRWFAGGKGLDEFRSQMLGDKHISHLVDYPNASDCFPGVEIKGGVSYFLWDKNHNGDCSIRSMKGEDVVSEMTRPLSSYDVFIRHNQAISILEKVQTLAESTLDKKVSSRKPFGFATNFADFQDTEFKNSVKIYARGRTGWVAKDKIVVHPEWIDKYKVISSRAYGAGSESPHQITGKPICITPNTCCTETYLVVNAFDSEEHSQNLASYLKTRFVRFLISIKKNTQDLNKDRFAFVPDLDMSIEWTDKMLYAKYKLTDEEIVFINSIVKEM